MSTTMMSLEDSTRTLKNVLASANSRDEKAGPLDVKFEEFEATKYRIWEDNNGNLQLSLTFPSLPAIQKAFSIAAELAGYFAEAGLKMESSEAGELIFTITKANLTEAAIDKISLLRHKLLAIPYKQAFQASDNKAAGKQVTLLARGNEAVYIIPYADRVMVSFAIEFENASDAVLGKVFLQEFFDTRQKPTCHNAPSVIYGKELPAELAPFVDASVKDKLFFISFALLPRHYSGEKQDQAASQLINFRSYLHYHLKLTKAYLHNRMRSKVSDFLKVLNRAKIENNTC